MVAGRMQQSNRPIPRWMGLAPQFGWMMTDGPQLERATATAEDALLARVQAGDRAALVEIHDRFHARIFRFVALQVADGDVAADLTSEVFVRFLDALDGPRAPRSSLQGWLFGVARNVVNMHHRQRYRHPEVAIDEALPAEGDLDDAVADVDDRAALAAALAALTDEQQQVLALRYGSGLPIAEAAAAMGKSDGAIKQLQARAVAALARQMTQRTVTP